ARPPRDHLRPARLPLPAGKNRPDRGRAALPAPASVNAKNRVESARTLGAARRTRSPHAVSAAPKATINAIRRGSGPDRRRRPTLVTQSRPLPGPGESRTAAGRTARLTFPLQADG